MLALAPLIQDLPPTLNANGHGWHHADCLPTDIILDGFKAGDRPEMPAFRDSISEADADTIVSYVKGWWTDEQLAFQTRVTEESCGSQ